MDKQKIINDLQSEFPHGHKDFIPLTLTELELHSNKNRDYTFGGESLGNFNRVSNILSNYPNLKYSPVVVAIIYALKQLDSSLWMMSNNYEGNIEGVDKRLEDIHVYFKLARILYKEEQEKKKKETV